MNEQLHAQIQRERERYIGAISALQHRLEGFDAAVALITGDGTAGGEISPPAQLPAPRAPKARRKARGGGSRKQRTAAATAAQSGAPDVVDPKEQKLRKLWATDMPASEIATAIGCAGTYVYTLAKALGLPKRQGVPRAGKARAPTKRIVAAPEKPSAEPEPARAVAKQAVVTEPVAARPRSAPVAAPTRPKTDEDAAIAAHIASKGVTRAVSFGVHQAAVDAARAMGMEVLRLAGPAPWSLNGAAIQTNEFYSRINAERRRRALPALEQPTQPAKAGAAG